jgi:hypothetical protein
MIEIPLHGAKAAGRVALIDDDDLPLIEQYRWFVWEVPTKGYGPYPVAHIGSGRSAPTMLMHQLLTGHRLTDHENHDGLDNRRANLRPATRRQNLHNQRPVRGGTSQYKGVSRRGNRWRARIKVNGQEIALGYFSAETDAARAYDTAAVEHFGEFACLNLGSAA